MEWLRALWADTAELRDSAATVIADAWAATADLRITLWAALTDLWARTANLRADAAQLSDGFGGWITSVDLNLSRDSAIVASVLLLLLAVPSIISAWVDRRVPQIGMVMVLAGVFMTYWTLQTYPDDYHWQDVPLAFIEVIGAIVN